MKNHKNNTIIYICFLAKKKKKPANTNINSQKQVREKSKGKFLRMLKIKKIRSWVILEAKMRNQSFSSFLVLFYLFFLLSNFILRKKIFLFYFPLLFFIPTGASITVVEFMCGNFTDIYLGEY